jgi:hypothetical protein
LISGAEPTVPRAADARRRETRTPPVCWCLSSTNREIDTERRKVVGTIRGIKEPQGIYNIARFKRLVVASGGDGNNVRIYDQEFQATGHCRFAGRRVQRTLRLSEQPSLCRIRTGSFGIIDPDKAVKVAEIPLDGHSESFQLERNEARTFVNVPTAGEIELLDREKRLVLTKWKLTAADDNFPMALDESNQRLFVGP